MGMLLIAAKEGRNLPINSLSNLVIASTFLFNPTTEQINKVKRGRGKIIYEQKQTIPYCTD